MSDRSSSLLGSGIVIPAFSSHGYLRSLKRDGASTARSLTRKAPRWKHSIRSRAGTLTMPGVSVPAWLSHTFCFQDSCSCATRSLNATRNLIGRPCLPRVVTSTSWHAYASTTPLLAAHTEHVPRSRKTCGCPECHR